LGGQFHGVVRFFKAVDKNTETRRKPTHLPNDRWMPPRHDKFGSGVKVQRRVTRHFLCQPPKNPAQDQPAKIDSLTNFGKNARHDGIMTFICQSAKGVFSKWLCLRFRDGLGRGEA
jgi:hypothetical protein